MAPHGRYGFLHSVRYDASTTHEVAVHEALQEVHDGLKQGEVARRVERDDTRRVDGVSAPPSEVAAHDLHLRTQLAEARHRSGHPTGHA